MNYLAHTLLSPKNINFQLGNLLSDTLKGRGWEGCTQDFLDGISMHKAIDRFTDESPIVDNAMLRLGSGYLKGVVVDITFDHFLSKHWAQFVNVSQAEFTAEFYRNAAPQLVDLPPKGKAFIERVLQYDILNSYETFEDLAVVLSKVNRRLSKKLLERESATDYLPRLAAKYDALEDDFLAFFPTLITMFSEKTGSSPNAHYLNVID